MPGPQLEDGYTRIANELLEAIIALKVPGGEFKVILSVIRKTYGYGKKQDAISYGQIAEMTGICMRNVIRLMNHLVDLKVLGSDKTATISGGVIATHKRKKILRACAILLLSLNGSPKRSGRCSLTIERPLRRQWRSPLSIIS